MCANLFNFMNTFPVIVIFKVKCSTLILTAKLTLSTLQFLDMDKKLVEAGKTDNETVLVKI